MGRIVQWIQQHKRIWIGVLLACVTIFVLAWTGYNIVRTVNGQSQYLQVHDYYDENQVMDASDPTQGWYQSIKAGPKTPLYGIRLYFDTHNRVVHGTMHVDLLDQNGQVLTSGQCDMTEILGKDFQGIVFNQPVFPAADGTPYTLHIYYMPQTAEDVVGLIYGTGSMPQVELDANGIPITDPDNPIAANAANPNFPLTDAVTGQQIPATAAMQYITNYSGNIGWRIFAPVAILMFVATMGGWWLIVCRKVKLHVSFAWFAVTLGLTYSLVTPPLAAPDEYTHMAGAYSLANQMMGYPAVQVDYDNYAREVYSLPMRACDAPYMRSKSGDIGVFAYKQILDHPGGLGNDPQTSEMVTVVAPVNIQTIQYLPQALGIAFARMIGLGFYPMLLLGRIFSVAAYAALMTFAVKVAPFGKKLFYAAALLPMGLELAGSFSADTMVLGLTYLFTALCLQGAYGTQPFGWGKKLAVLIIAVLFAPAKAIYILMVALCLMIRQDCFPSKWHSWGYKAAVCVASVVSWQMANLKTVAYMLRSIDTERIGLAATGAAILLVLFGLAWFKWHGKPMFRKAVAATAAVAVVALAGVAVWVLGNSGQYLTPEEMAAGIQPNGESIYTFGFGYMIANPTATIKLLLATVSQQLPTYLQGLVGALPGEPIVHHLQISWILTVGLVLVLLASALRSHEEMPHIHTKVRLGMVIVILSVTALMVMAALVWTPINATSVFGIQGRYLLPILPLILLLLGENQSFCTRRSIDKGISLCGGFMTAAVILQSMALFCGA